MAKMEIPCFHLKKIKDIFCKHDFQNIICLPMFKKQH